MMNPNATDAARTSLAPTDMPHAPANVKDMNDELELEQEWPPSPQLLAAIAHYQATLKPAYDKANTLALAHQKKHQRVTVFAALAGSIAVIFAIMGLTPLKLLFQPQPQPKPPALAVAEVLAALAAAAAVWWGVRAAFHDHWLLERHRAERIRLLKFCALREPTLLEAQGADISAWRTWFDAQLAQLEQLDKQAMKHWVESEPFVEVPRRWERVQVTDGTLLALVKYFQLKRLGVQYNYFTARAARNVKLNRETGWLPRLFFFASVGAALLHFALDSLEYYFHVDLLAPFAAAHAEAAGAAGVAHWWQVFLLEPHWWVLVLLAAALPVAGAAMRTVRSANEFSRHGIRYRAKAVGLAFHANLLKDEAQKLKPVADRPVPAADAERVLLDLWGSEQIMESEHREWLRLMMEAEWFG